MDGRSAGQVPPGRRNLHGDPQVDERPSAKTRQVAEFVARHGQPEPDLSDGLVSIQPDLSDVLVIAQPDLSDVLVTAQPDLSGFRVAQIGQRF